MSDAKDKSREESAPSEPQGPIGGERLAAARREQKIIVPEIAKELHLDEPKVRALERNEFDVLGAAVFAKGHLRKYAQLVGVDETDVMADYYELTRAASMPPLVSTRRRPRREMAPGPWIAVIVVVILLATAYWWFTSGRPLSTVPEVESAAQEQAQEQAPEQAPEPGAEIAQPESQPQGPVADIGSDDSAVLQSGDTEPEAQAPAAELQETPVLDDGQIRLLLTYTGDCWTEISDAGGRRLFFGLGKDGRTVELSGEAPFNALFGNANNVLIRVNGSERAINAEERRGRTARLTIEGD